MKTVRAHHSRKQTILELQTQIQTWGRGDCRDASACTSTSCGSFDSLLPGHGIREGSLIEWLGEGDVSGVGLVSLVVGRQVCPRGRPVVLIDTRHDLFPLSLSLLGFDLSQLVLVRPDNEREALWACEEALRCDAVGLVWANLDPPNSTSFRRLQLAVESSAGIGFLVRSAQSLRQPSWAEVRLKVQPRPAHCGNPCFRVDVVSSGGQPRCSTTDITIDRQKGGLDGSENTANTLPLVS